MSLIMTPTSLQTSMVPNTICMPSKKLSPIIITVVPPVVQPSLGQMAFIQGVAGIHNKRTSKQREMGINYWGKGGTYMMLQTITGDDQLQNKQT